MTVSSDRSARIREHLYSWALGVPLGRVDPSGTVGSTTVVLEDARDLTAVMDSDLVGQRTLVLRPGGLGGEQVVGYEGSLTLPGEECAAEDEVFLQVQEYRACPYTAILSGTVVRMTEVADFEAYVEDADRARSAGEFAAFLVDPAVRLADVCALGGPPHGDGPRARILVGRGGELLTSPSGVPLGQVGDSLDQVAADYAHRNATDGGSCAVCLHGVLPEPVRRAALADRPWLVRYLDALGAVRELAARGVGGVRVSGFGLRLLPGLPGPAETSGRDDARGALLLWTDTDAYIHDPAARRTFRLGRRAGELAEALLVCGSTEAAAEYADADQLRQVDGLLARASVRELRAETVRAAT